MYININVNLTNMILVLDDSSQLSLRIITTIIISLLLNGGCKLIECGASPEGTLLVPLLITENSPLFQ